MLLASRLVGQGLTGRDRGSVAYLTADVIPVACCCCCCLTAGGVSFSAGSARDAEATDPQKDVSILAGDGHLLGERIDLRSGSGVPEF